MINYICWKPRILNTVSEKYFYHNMLLEASNCSLVTKKGTYFPFFCLFFTNVEILKQLA